jgi:hypothetical protein
MFVVGVVTIICASTRLDSRIVVVDGTRRAATRAVFCLFRDELEQNIGSNFEPGVGCQKGFEHVHFVAGHELYAIVDL